MRLGSLLAAAAGTASVLADASLLAVAAAAGAASLFAVAAAGATPWSTPAVLSACPAASAAQVVFPSDSPSKATGAGAIVWSASSRCPGGEGARVAAIGTGDVPGVAAIPHTATGRPIVPWGPLLASGGPHGQIVVAGSAPGAQADGLLIQGNAGGPFAALGATTGGTAPTAIARGYLGDVALASPPSPGDVALTSPPTPGDPALTSPPTSGHGIDRLSVHVERFFAHGFVRNVTARTAGTGAVQALTLAMDFRSEVLVVWVQGHAIYARLVPNKGAPRRVQRIASVGADPTITAVLSDDERAIVAWSDQRDGETSVYVDRSAVGVRFGAPELLERFHDPDGLPSPTASPSLVRLSSESVVLAWAGSAAGHWVVRTAPVELGGVGAVTTIPTPGVDALLADLAAGPDGDALVLWTEPQPTAAGPPDMERQALFAAQGFDGAQARTVFDEPEEVAPPAPVGDATVALDPANDRAVAVWQGEAATIEYSIRTATQPDGQAGPTGP